MPILDHVVALAPSWLEALQAQLAHAHFQFIRVCQGIYISRMKQALP
jgi:hypothetical protein